jgi:hypothetical protein
MEHALATTAAAMTAAMDLALVKMWAAMSATLAAADKADKQCRRKNAARETALADNAKAQRLQELAKHAAALVELVLAMEHVAKSWWITLQCWRRQLSPMSIVARMRRIAAQR